MVALAERRAVRGAPTTATGPDPSKVFEFRYAVVDLDDLEPSHDATLTPNPRFPEGLQPRIRDRQASRQQIRQIANKLQPDALITDMKTLDRGPMIIGPDNVVESGNGRTIALKLAKLEFPKQYADYVRTVRERAHEFGIDSKDLAGIDDPVLVRERVTRVDRKEFAALANQSATLTMSPVEQALQDSKRLSDQALATLRVGENQSIDQALRSPANLPLITKFLEGLPQNEQASLQDATGNLNLIGLQRVKAAVFAKVFQGKAGERLTQAFFESVDPTVKQVENAVFDSLPALAKAEGLVRAGDRNRDLAIGDDIAKAVDMLARLKQEGLSVEDFLGQSGLFERELTVEQEKLLAFLDEQGRSRKRMAEFIKGYARAVEASPPPQQAALFPTAQESKSEIIERQVKEQRKEATGGTVGLFALIEERERAGFEPAPKVAPTAQPAAEARPATGEASQELAEPADTVAPALPTRTPDTMSEAIALSSPSGSMSKAARARANERLRSSLFGRGLQRPTTPQPAETVKLRRQAAELRSLADRGMGVRKNRAAAKRLEAEAAEIEQAPVPGSPVTAAPSKPAVAPTPERGASQSAVRHFNDPTAGVRPGRARRRLDIDRQEQASTVAPAEVKTADDARLQARWHKDPSRSDMQGVDTAEERFILPRGATLPEGTFPAVVEWTQGVEVVRVDLVTGASTFRANKGSPRRRPLTTFRVVSTTRAKPPRRTLRMGVVSIELGDDRLIFTPEKTARPNDRTFRTERARI